MPRFFSFHSLTFSHNIVSSSSTLHFFCLCLLVVATHQRSGLDCKEILQVCLWGFPYTLIHSSHAATNHTQGFICFCSIYLSLREKKPPKTRERQGTGKTNIWSNFGPPASGFPPNLRSHSCANNKHFPPKFQIYLTFCVKSLYISNICSNFVAWFWIIFGFHSFCLPF